MAKAAKETQTKKTAKATPQEIGKLLPKIRAALRKLHRDGHRAIAIQATVKYLAQFGGWNTYDRD
jgi:hypothetical protein